MILLEASVLIAQLGGNDAHHERAQQLLLHVVDQDLAASPISLAEVLVWLRWLANGHRVLGWSWAGRVRTRVAPDWLRSTRATASG